MKRSAKNKTVIIMLAIIAVLAVGGATYIKVDQKRDQQADGVSKSGATAAGPAHDTPPADAPVAPQSSPSHPVTSNLAKPIGPNNNTSTVSLSGATGMESVCRTLAGTSCYIQASKGSQVIKVSDTQVIGSAAASDGAIFNWDAKQLSVGQWSIQAIASKNNQSATSNPQILTVSP